MILLVLLVLKTNAVEIEETGVIELMQLECHILSQLDGDLLCIERLHYNFAVPHAQVYRSLPAGYHPYRINNNDGLGNFFVFLGNDTTPLPEAIPSVSQHVPNTFEIFEDVCLFEIFIWNGY